MDNSILVYVAYPFILFLAVYLGVLFGFRSVAHEISLSRPLANVTRKELPKTLQEANREKTRETEKHPPILRTPQQRQEIRKKLTEKAV